MVEGMLSFLSLCLDILTAWLLKIVKGKKNQPNVKPTFKLNKQKKQQQQIFKSIKLNREVKRNSLKIIQLGIKDS